MSAYPTLFVSGASGQLGRRVIELLRERGFAGRIIAGTRNPAALEGIAGVEVRQAGFEDVTALTAALDGVDRMLLISTTPADDGRTQLHLNAVAAAKAAGVKHIVYTSMPQPDANSPISFASHHRATEEAIAASGIPHTILRMMWYSENLLQTLPQAIATGSWFTAAADGRQAYVSREDCARAAAGALLAGGNESRALDVTGPEAFTTEELGKLVSSVTGKPVEVLELTESQLAFGLKQAGVPDAVVQGFILPFDRHTAQGRAAKVTDTVRELWGTPPETLKAFLERNRAALG